MSISSDSEEISDYKDNDKDEDFDKEAYRNDLDSDDSYEDIPETNKEDNIEEEEEVTDREKQEYVGPVLPGGHRFDRKFVCIKYPGNVINPDKAIDTLGGICNVSKTVEASNRRLELRFRPDNAYCKPACGERHRTSAFLLRVRIKKSRLMKLEELLSQKDRNRHHANDSSDNIEAQSAESKDEPIISDLVNRVQDFSVTDTAPKHSNSEGHKEKNKKNTPPTFDRNKYEDLSQDEQYELPKLKVLGQVDTEFRFQNLCDFQYLPLTHSKEKDKLECIYNKVYPSDVPHYSWLKTEAPYFLPPAAFSRMDSIQQYVPKTEVNADPENVIGKNRKRKSGFSNFIYFSTPEVPCRPPVGIETAMRVKFVQNIHYQQMLQIFEERPIWSKNAIAYKTRFSHDRLKILLPSVAYYFVTGPWKIMWVKLGYDPRKDITARKYQTLDYRLKAMHGLGSTVKCKRNYSEYTLPYKSVSASKQKRGIYSMVSGPEQSQRKEDELNESVYIYREGTIPPSRQMFYQYCDVLVDEIQEMLNKLPDPLPGTKCHEKRGWLPSGFGDQCREIINKQVRAVLRKQMNIPEDHPTSLPRKRKLGIKLKLNKLKTKRRKKKKKSESVCSGEEDGEVSSTPIATSN